jgi:hypothetical protein
VARLRGVWGSDGGASLYLAGKLWIPYRLSFKASSFLGSGQAIAKQVRRRHADKRWGQKDRFGQPLVE